MRVTPLITGSLQPSPQPEHSEGNTTITTGFPERGRAWSQSSISGRLTQKSIKASYNLKVLLGLLTEPLILIPHPGVRSQVCCGGSHAHTAAFPVRVPPGNQSTSCQKPVIWLPDTTITHWPHFSLEKCIWIYSVADTITPMYRKELPLELSTSGRVNLTRGVILSRHHFLLSAYRCIFQRYKRNSAKVLVKGFMMNMRSWAITVSRSWPFW